MTKTQKKIDGMVTRALTGVCEIARLEVDGFEWLTHLVNYDNFPDSLSIVCVFDTNARLSAARRAGGDEYICQLIQAGLESINIIPRDAGRFVSFDTQEDCMREHGGKWRTRLGWAA